jgi:hypothetical protein
MSLSLVEALGQVDLEAGRVHRCHVKDKWVELRVLGLLRFHKFRSTMNQT